MLGLCLDAANRLPSRYAAGGGIVQGQIAIARFRLILALQVLCLEATTLPRGQLQFKQLQVLLPIALSIPLVVGCDYNRIASTSACP